MIKPVDSLQALFEYPHLLGQAVGFADMTELHGQWIKKMVFSRKDYTLQAHRGSYKSSCLAVAISMILFYYPDRNIIFLRKTDNDVAEMLGMVSKILKTEVFRDLVREYTGKELAIVGESMNHASAPPYNVHDDPGDRSRSRARCIVAQYGVHFPASFN